MSPRQVQKRAYLWMLGCALSFATMGAVSHALGSRCSWQIVVLARTSVALILSASGAFASRVPLVFLRPKTLWMRSIAGSGGMVCTFFALTHLPISDATTLINTTPIWIVLLSWIVSRKGISFGVLAAVACGIAGIVAIQQPHFASASNAVGVGVGSAFFTAIAMMSLNRLAGVNPLAIVVHFSAVSTLMAVGLLVAFAPSLCYPELSDHSTVALLLGVGVCGTLGQIAMTRAFALGRPTGVSVVGLAQVPFAVLYDIVLWGRTFNPVTIVGILLTMLPVAWLLLRDPHASEQADRLETLGAETGE